MDFLFLLALHMDPNRNLEHYVNPGSSKVEEFLGLPAWRESWANAEGQRIKFLRYLAEDYSRQMNTLGYLLAPWDKMKQVRLDPRNLPLYSLRLVLKARIGV
jgi:hypothetical protein